MPWPTANALRSGKRPIWLYEFTRGGVVTRFTSQLTDYTDDDSVVWTSNNLLQSRIRKTSVGERAAVRLTFPRTNTFAQSYRDDLSFEANKVKIYHEYKGYSPVARRAKFVGRVIGLEQTIVTITMVAENDFTYLRAKGTNTVLQRPCRHAHYYRTVDGYGCGAVLADNQIAGTLTGLTGGNIASVSAASSSADGHYTRGVLEWNGLRQTISVHEGSTLELHRPIEGLEAAQAGGNQAVLIAPGCPGTRAACDGTFGVLPDFGGMPWSDEFIGDGRTLF